MENETYDRDQPFTIHSAKKITLSPTAQAWARVLPRWGNIYCSEKKCGNREWLID
jgi:hypothetical protein